MWPADRDLAELLPHPANAQIVAHLTEVAPSAHSDVAQILFDLTYPLVDCETWCPDPSSYAYVIAHSHGMVFGLAEGSHGLHLKVPAEVLDEALRTGTRRPELGEGWVEFDPFDPNRPTSKVMAELMRFAERAHDAALQA